MFQHSATSRAAGDKFGRSSSMRSQADGQRHMLGVTLLQATLRSLHARWQAAKPNDL